MADDPKDELRARFEDHRTPSEKESESETDQTNKTDDAADTDNMSDSPNTHNTGSTSDTSETGSTGTRPGPERDPDSTRNRKQVAFYLSEETRDRLSERYDEYDALSKLAGEGGIEKHKDFLEPVVRAGLESEQLDGLIGIDRDEIDR
jgi:hypothetical protein